jgi:hypothetical protein
VDGVDHVVPPERKAVAARASKGRPGGPAGMGGGGRSACDLWFPPREIPLEDGTAKLLPVLVITAAYSRFMGENRPLRRSSSPSSLSGSSLCTRFVMYRVIAALLSQAIGGRRLWECRSGVLDSSGGGGEVRSDLFDRFPLVSRRLRTQQDDDVPGALAYRFWFLTVADVALGIRGQRHVLDRSRRPDCAFSSLSPHP